MANWKLGKVQYGFVSTATSGGTLTLTKDSKQIQLLTGTLSHSVQLPDATVVAKAGISFIVVNQSTTAINVNYNDASLLLQIAAGQTKEFLLTDVSTSNGVWRIITAGGSASVGAVSPGALITSNYAVVSGDNGRVLNIDTSTLAIDVTLPAPAAGFKITIKDDTGNASVNKISIIRNGSEKIDDVAAGDQIAENYAAVTLVSDGTDWFRIISFTGIAPATAPIGLTAGGYTGAYSAVIDQVVITTLGNATSFGNLSVARSEVGAAGSATRGVFATGTNGSQQSTIDYVTIATAGNATTFGTTTVTRSATSGCGSSTRGVFGGGITGGAATTIDYITFASVGNATSFGALTVARYYLGACSSPTRGIFGSGNGGTSTIDYITIATTGNATSFGSLSPARSAIAGCSSATRGVFSDGANPGLQNSVDYVTIATTGNSTNFGTLSVSRSDGGACSSAIRGIFTGGFAGGSSSVIDYITIATTGNATSFGNLSVARSSPSSCSNAHGGL